jgi:hypothetical protein
MHKPQTCPLYCENVKYEVRAVSTAQLRFDLEEAGVLERDGRNNNECLYRAPFGDTGQRPLLD